MQKKFSIKRLICMKLCTIKLQQLVCVVTTVYHCPHPHAVL